MQYQPEPDPLADLPCMLEIEGGGGSDIAKIMPQSLFFAKGLNEKPKKIWMEVIRQDIETKGLNEGILLDRNEWRNMIHVPYPV